MRAMNSWVNKSNSIPYYETNHTSTNPNVMHNVKSCELRNNLVQHEQYVKIWNNIARYKFIFSHVKPYKPSVDKWNNTGSYETICRNTENMSANNFKMCNMPIYCYSTLRFLMLIYKFIMQSVISFVNKRFKMGTMISFVDI